MPCGSLSPSDTAATLPSALTNVTVGTPFYLEIWTTDTGTPLQGISGGFLNLAYNSSEVDATALNHGSTYTTLTSGTIDNSAGLVSDFGGNALASARRGTAIGLGWGGSRFPGRTRERSLLRRRKTLSTSSQGFPAGAWIGRMDAPAATLTLATPEPSSLVLLAAASAGLASVVLGEEGIAGRDARCGVSTRVDGLPDNGSTQAVQIERDLR